MYYWCRRRQVQVPASVVRLRFPRKKPLFSSGAEGIRTPDLRRAKAALSRLSYGPGRIGR